MKKLLYIPLILLSLWSAAQNPTIISNPYNFLKWVKIGDSLRVGIIFIGSTDTAASQAYVRAHSGGAGSINPGYGIRISNDSVILDTANVRKMDSLYTVTDSTGIFKINGRAYAFKLRGAVWSFNGRIGPVVPQVSDYAAFYPQLAGSYADPSFIASISWPKVTATPNSVSGYGILDAVRNAGGGYSWASDAFANRPAPGRAGAFFYAIDSNKIYFDNATAWTAIAGGGSSIVDTTIVGSYGLLTTTSGSTKTFKIDTTTLKPIFGGSGGIFQLYNKYPGVIFHGADTVDIDTSVVPRWSDTLTRLASRTYVNTRGFLLTESDPVATAKNITMTPVASGGIVVVGTNTQSLGTSPAWAFRVDSSVFSTITGVKDTAQTLRAMIAAISGYDSTIMETIYRVDTAKAALRTSIAGKQPAGSYLTSESDPIAIAKTISDSAAYGILINGLKTQALNLNPFWTFKIDTTVVAPLHRIADTSAALRALFAAGGQNLTAGSGLTGGTYNGSSAVTYKVDSSLYATTTSLGRQGFKIVGVDTIFRTVGKDSICFTINGRNHCILDSAAGGTAGVDTTVLAGYGLSRATAGTVVTIKYDSTQTGQHGQVYNDARYRKTFLDSLAGGLVVDSAIIVYRGNSGDTLLMGSHDTLFSPLFRDSLNFHLVKNADGSITGYSTGSGGVDTTVLAGYGLSRSTVGTVVTVKYDSTQTGQHGQAYNDTRYRKTFLDSLATGLIIDSTIITYLGASGDTLIRGSHDTLYTALFRDSLGFHLVKNADGSITGYAISGSADSTVFYTKYRSDTSRTNIYAAIAGKQATGNYITALTGDVTATGPGSVSATIGANKVTYAKMQAAAGAGLLGATGASNFQLLTIGTGLTLTGTTLSASAGGGNIPLDSVLKTGPTSTRSMAVGGFKATGADTLSGTTYNSTKGKVVILDTATGILYHQSIQTLDTTGATVGKIPTWNGTNFVLSSPTIVADSVVTITTGTSSTVPNRCNILRINPSSTISNYTITLPTTWHASDNLLISFGGTLTSGAVVTTLTIVAGSGQTLLQAVTPNTGSAGEIIQYHLIGTIDQRMN